MLDRYEMFSSALWAQCGRLACALLFAVLSAMVSTAGAEETDPATWVQPLAPAKLKLVAPDSRAAKLISSYHASIVAWDDILLPQLKPVPAKPGCGFYGQGGHEENDIRPICYAALINAFLAETELAPGQLAQARRPAGRSDALAALAYLAQGHVTGAGTCLNGRQWGGQWQSALWARSAGLAAWILWPHLPEETKRGMARLIEFEADRFDQLQPKSSRFHDTGAEENAWNAQILSLACNMMPAHPRAARWDEQAKRWMYNTFSVEPDATDGRAGDDGRAVRHWVQTTNAHPDFTVENHGLVHVGYLQTALSLLLENALPYLLADRPVPQAVRHHAAESFEVLLRCMAWDGSPIYFSGNDWKIVHAQASATMVFGLMDLLLGDPAAAYLEPIALEYAVRLQQANAGYYNERRDLEYGGLCSSRMLAALWTRALRPSKVRPLSRREFETRISGVTVLPHGKAILHRTPSTFCSFSWGQKRMALALPENGSWITWPHFASYVGEVNGIDAGEKSAKLVHIQQQAGTNQFRVDAIFERFNGAVTQAVSFVSLPEEVAIYVERWQARPGFSWRSRESGIVGLEYDLGENQRVLHSRQGRLSTLGVGGEKRQVHMVESDWLNISDRVGHVVKRFPPRENVMRYHDEVAGSGRVPILQEWISLAGDKTATQVAPAGEWTCLVTFLNQKARRTESAAAQVKFSVAENVAICRVGKRETRIEFKR